MTEPDRPPVTVVNPHAPAGTADLLSSGSDRPPWRPSRRSGWLTALVVLLVVVAAGGAAWARELRADRADQRLARGMELTVSASLDGSIPPFLVVQAGGAQAVTVEWLQVLDKGFGRQPVDVELLPGAPVSLPLLAGHGCDAHLLRSQPQRVVIHARTLRGSRFARTLALPPEIAEPLARAERVRCGMLPPEEVLGSQTLGILAGRGTVTFELQLSNVGSVPLTVESLVPVTGLRISPLRPVTMTGSGETAPPVTLTATVTSCRAYALRGATELLLANVRTRHVSGPALLNVDPAVYDALQSGCPSYRFPPRIIGY